MKKCFDRSSYINQDTSIESLWSYCMLTPHDYSKEALEDEVTRSLFHKVWIELGDEEYDSFQPSGNPASIKLVTDQEYESEIIRYPVGHPQNEDTNLGEMLQHKFKQFGLLGLESSEMMRFVNNLENIDAMENSELDSIYDCKIKYERKSIDQ